MIAGRDRGYPRAHFAHDPCALMAQNAGKQAFAVQPIKRICIGVANARGHNLDQHFARLGAFQIKLDNLQRGFGRKGYSSTGLHRSLSARLFVGAGYGMAGAGSIGFAMFRHAQ